MRIGNLLMALFEARHSEFGFLRFAIIAFFIPGGGYHPSAISDPAHFGYSVFQKLLTGTRRVSTNLYQLQRPRSYRLVS